MFVVCLTFILDEAIRSETTVRWNLENVSLISRTRRRVIIGDISLMAFGYRSSPSLCIVLFIESTKIFPSRNWCRNVVTEFSVLSIKEGEPHRQSMFFFFYHLKLKLR